MMFSDGIADGITDGIGIADDVGIPDDFGS